METRDKQRSRAGNPRIILLGGDFALHITSVIMMLVTILLMIDDRCSIGFAKKMLTMYIIYYNYVVKTGAKHNYTGSLLVDRTGLMF